MKPIAQYRSRFIMWCVTILFVFLVQNLCAQYMFNGVVKGRVVDDSTNTPLPLANIFVANSTIGAVADIEGIYQIKEIPYGIHQIVASIVGYTPQIVTVHMIDATVKEIVFRLKPQNIQVSPVVIEGNEPTEWKRNLKKFLAEFFGSTPNATQCKLLNPEVLDFAVDEYTSEFTATVREPLIIENKALGYRLYYYLQYFKLKNKQHHFFGTGNFEELHSESTEEIKQWKINRQNTYHGSKRHFFSTLFHKNSKEEGFKVSSIPKELGRSARFFANGGEVDLDTLLTNGESKYEKKLSFSDMLQVIYGDNIFNKKMSYVKLEQQSITIYSNGEIAEPLGILTFGDWSTQRAAEFLPWDYEP